MPPYARGEELWLALIEGTCWSLAFGATIGVLIALVYNALSGLFRP
jgi:hypothetical protein